jgi:putative transferase (TIGR04331 family)
MLNRFNTLEQCIKEHEISGITAYANDDYALTTPDSYSAILVSNDDRWNNALSVRILDLIGATSWPVEVIEDCTLQSFRFNTVAVTPPLKRKILKWGYQMVSKLANCLVRDNDAFIIKSYLPMKEEIKLQLTLKQCPQLWVSPKYEIVEKPDRALRERLAKQFTSQSGNKLEHILSVMLFELLPVCFLEDFSNLNMLVKQQSWPKFPKFIFTSNNFDTDEVFKLWVATKVEHGSKYFVGQHGNNYGTYRYDHPTLEETTADKFITWGWTDYLPQHTPAFIFKTVGRKACYNPFGGLLLIELYLSYRISTWDNTSEFSSYFLNQQIFVRSLSSAPKSGLVIRLHYVSRAMNWNEESRWRDIDPSIKIDIGQTHIQDLISQSRLVVHSYDSTGMLETLSQNIPTLAFWLNGLDHLRDSAKPFYQILVDAGIVLLTPESAAQKVNEVWDDVDGWWGQSSVQDARRQFCDRYAKFSANPVMDIKKHLTANDLN